MHCYGDSRLIRHEENRQPGLADKLRCTGILARSGMLASELDTAVLGGRQGTLAVVSIGGNDIERCETMECVRRAEDRIGHVVSRLSHAYDRVAILGPPRGYRHQRLPLSSGDVTRRLEKIVGSYPGARVLRIDHIPAGYTSDGVHFDDATNTRVAATIFAVHGDGPLGPNQAPHLSQ
jgi:lysophospholipase L1-like esterase